MSDPVINGDLPAPGYHLNEQPMWAAAYYTAYGHYTSVIGALAAWAIIPICSNGARELPDACGNWPPRHAGVLTAHGIRGLGRLT
jgi:hypothetical protein